jgi:hypothetical protein
MNRTGQTGNWDSSLRTMVKQTRNVYANALAQRTAVNNNRASFMNLQSASVGQGGTANVFSIAVDTGAANLSCDEVAAIVAQNS